MSLQPCIDAICARQSDRDKGQSLLQTIIWLGTTESQEATTGFTEALAAQTRDTELVVGRFQEIQSESVAGDSQAITDRLHAWEDIKRGGWIER